MTILISDISEYALVTEMDLNNFTLTINNRKVLGLRSQKTPTCVKYGCFLAEKEDTHYNISVYVEGIRFTAKYTEDTLKTYVAMLLDEHWLWMVPYDLESFLQ